MIVKIRQLPNLKTIRQVPGTVLIRQVPGTVLTGTVLKNPQVHRARIAGTTYK